jgi:hypothetical protein
MPAKRELDVVVLGASGYTGSRVLRCLAKKNTWYEELPQPFTPGLARAAELRCVLDFANINVLHGLFCTLYVYIISSLCVGFLMCK